MSEYASAQWELLQLAEKRRSMGAPSSAYSMVRAAQALAPLTPEMEDIHADLIAAADPFIPSHREVA